MEVTMKDLMERYEKQKLRVTIENDMVHCDMHMTPENFVSVAAIIISDYAQDPDEIMDMMSHIHRKALILLDIEEDDDEDD